MKVLFSTLMGLVVLAIVAASIGGVILWARLPDMLSNTLSKKMQVPVSVQSLGASWGQIAIHDIRVNNPPKSILAHALTCQQISIDAPFSRYFHDAIVIEEIHLTDIYLGLEFNSATTTDGNWTLMMDRIKAQEKRSPSQKTGTRSLLIKKLVLTNTDVDVVYRKEGGKIQRLPRIPYMEITNISSEGGLPMDQIMNSVLGEMLKEVFIKQNLKNMLKTLIEQNNTLNQFLSPFQKFLNTRTEEKLDSPV
jgi:hypothetical protein